MLPRCIDAGKRDGSEFDYLDEGTLAVAFERLTAF